MMKTQRLSRNASVTVGTSNTVVAQQASEPAYRELVTIINTSTGGQVISLGFGQEAVAGTGVVLNPGGSYTEDADKTPCTQDQINAISTLAGGTIAVREVTAMPGY